MCVCVCTFAKKTRRNDKLKLVNGAIKVVRKIFTTASREQNARCVTRKKRVYFLRVIFNGVKYLEAINRQL